MSVKKIIQLVLLVVFVFSCKQSGFKEECKAEQTQAIQPVEVGNEDHQEKFMEDIPDRNPD